MDLPYRGDWLQPSRDRVSRHWTREGWKYAARVGRFAGYAVGGAVGLAAAGVQNFLQPVPDLRDKRMDIDYPVTPRYNPAGRKGFSFGLAKNFKARGGRSGVAASGAAMPVFRGSSGVAGGSTWQGNFRGRKHRGTGYTSTVRGFSETVKVAGFTRQLGCTYLGITSYPYLDSTDVGNAPEGSGKVCGRVFKDICVALVRHYFRHFHAGKLEFTSPDQSFRELLLPGGTLNIASQSEDIRIVYTDSLGLNQTVVNHNYMNAGGAGVYDNIRDLGNIIAVDMWTKWRLGLQPRFMYAERYNSTTFAELVSHGRMPLDQLRVSARCTTVLRVQNQSAAADGSTGILDTDANPLQGKIFYFKRISPGIATGHTMNAQVADAWGELNLSKPVDVSSAVTAWNQAPYLENIYASGFATGGETLAAPGGAWCTIPKAAYFKHCIGEKSVSMEPGVMKQFALRFRFRGKLSDWLRADASNFAQADTPTGTNAPSAEYTRGMGQCALLVVEKRIRDYTAGGATIPIQLAFECDTYIHTDVSHSRSRMTNSVQIGFKAL